MGGRNISDGAEIRIAKDGPYLVSGSVPLRDMIILANPEGDAIEWKLGMEYPLQNRFSLCRCGGSQNRPFCDGVHTKVHFDGTESADRRPYLELAEVTKGPDLELTDVKKLCASARFCLPQGGTWELTRNSDDPKSKELAIQQTLNCPAGRIVVWDKKTGEEIEPELEPSLGLVEEPYRNVSGPIWVRGKIPLESADGFPYEMRNRVTLCRCGKSSNKPFCDMSHKN